MSKKLKIVKLKERLQYVSAKLEADKTGRNAHHWRAERDALQWTIKILSDMYPVEVHLADNFIQVHQGKKRRYVTETKPAVAETTPTTETVSESMVESVYPALLVF